jgi:hypothetical protein
VYFLSNFMYVMPNYVSNPFVSGLYRRE